MITGAGQFSSKWVIRYFEGDVDITAQVTGAGYQTPVLAPGEQTLIKVTVKAKRTARVGSTKVVPVTVKSTADASYTDAVEARVTVKRR